MRPDALPVRALASSAVLPKAAVEALFGRGYALRGTERVRLVRLGRDVTTLPVAAAAAPALVLDAVDRAVLPAEDGLRWVGPRGAEAAPPPERPRQRLVVPEGLARAWGLAERATVGLGPLAVALDVAAGPEAAVEVDRALWLATGRPDVARWLPDVDLTAPEPEPEREPSAAILGRVVTETDVRQARLHRRTLRIEPGQIWTPAARSLAREYGLVFDP